MVGHGSVATLITSLIDSFVGSGSPVGSVVGASEFGTPSTGFSCNPVVVILLLLILAKAWPFDINRTIPITAKITVPII